MNMYRIREKMAYSVAGKILANILRDMFFRNSRIHWIQQGMADMSFKGLR